MAFEAILSACPAVADKHEDLAIPYHIHVYHKAILPSNNTRAILHYGIELLVRISPRTKGVLGYPDLCTGSLVAKAASLPKNEVIPALPLKENGCLIRRRRDGPGSSGFSETVGKVCIELFDDYTMLRFPRIVGDVCSLILTRVIGSERKIASK